jgi:hypothetical protein
VIKKIFSFCINELGIHSLNYVSLNVISRIISGFAQLYAVSIFLKLHNQQSATLIILLLGYVQWFNLLEFGLSQTLQNSFNSRRLSLKNIISIAITHYIFLIIICILNYQLDFTNNLLLENSQNYTSSDKKNFLIGSCFLILCSSNLILHRILLITKNAHKSNIILILQSMLIFFSLYIYEQTNYISQLNSIIIYLAPQIIFALIILIWMYIKINLQKDLHYKNINIKKILSSSISFFYNEYSFIRFIGNGLFLSNKICRR